MQLQLFPYGDRSHSSLVAKLGVHSGADKKLRSRMVGGKVVSGIQRRAD